MRETPVTAVSGVMTPSSFHLVNLRRLRELRGWERPELSQRSGVALPTLRGLEDQRSEPSLESAWRLATALGVSLEMLWHPAVSGEVQWVRLRRKRG